MKRARSKQDKDWQRYMNYLREKQQHRYAKMRVYDLLLSLCCRDYENGEKDHIHRLIGGKSVNQIITETITQELDGAWPLNDFEDFKTGFPYGLALNR